MNKINHEWDATTVNGVAFIHERKNNREYFEHRDSQKWSWVLQKYHVGFLGWAAFVIKPGKYNSVHHINGITHIDDTVQLGRLSSIDTYDHLELLAGMVKLINVGKWPEDIIVDRELYEKWEEKYAKENRDR